VKVDINADNFAEQTRFWPSTLSNQLASPVYATPAGRSGLSSNTYTRSPDQVGRPSPIKLSVEGEFHGCTLVRRRFLNVVDNDDFDRTFPRLQLEPELPLHSREDRGAFGRHALVHVEIKIEIK
jgi:hypothetical protein